MDFLKILSRSTKTGLEVYPSFEIMPSKDLMIRGGKFRAIWDQEKGMWSTSWYDVIRLVDNEIADYISKRGIDTEKTTIKWMRDNESGSASRCKNYIEKLMADNFHPLNSKLIFSNMKVKREDYASITLSYPLEKGKHESYDKLMDVLYSPEERMKIEWGIGCVVSNDIANQQKFIVLTGDIGTGKGTVLKIIRLLFEGYVETFNAKSLSGNDTFALEILKNGPLVAIQEDTKLDRIKDNTTLNSLISHEPLAVNAKYEHIYTQRFNTFIFMGSNGEVDITDAMSGIIRRLIDVRPTGITVSAEDYLSLMNQIKFELGAIAYHCMEVYKNNVHKYDSYKPLTSIRKTNIFFSFLEENYDEIKDGVSLKRIYDMYLAYCTDNHFTNVWTKFAVKNELMAYYDTFYPEKTIDYIHYKNYYTGIKASKFGKESSEVDVDTDDWLKLGEYSSFLDTYLADCPAQYANENGTPQKAWSNVTTTLRDIDTHKLHWLTAPDYILKIDFDKKGPDGEKNLELNIEAAKNFPKTYAEVSKSKGGLHLYYIWNGPAPLSELSRIYEEGIEIKLSIGKLSHRRILTLCNREEIATITSGLPLKKKGGNKVVDPKIIQTVAGLRTTIQKCLNKEVHADTTSNIHWIKEILDKAYNSGLVYDVSDLKHDVSMFAASSTNQKTHCIEVVEQMKFKSDAVSANEEGSDYILNGKKVLIYDIEVGKNILLLCWGYVSEKPVVHTMFNPSPKEVAEWYGFEEKLNEYGVFEVTKTDRPLYGGFNNRAYDDHILMGRILGDDNSQCYLRSHAIIRKEPNATLREAYDFADFDLYDITTLKQSLKRYELDYDLPHKEMDVDWDQPIPSEKWEELAKYCCNDVFSTIEVFKRRQSDIEVREFMAELSGLKVINTNRQHITKIICGDDKLPDLCYTDLSTGERYLNKRDYIYGVDTVVESIPVETPDNGIINSFPGYRFCPTGIPLDDYILEPASKIPKSWYMGEDPSEGGYVYAEPGMYSNVECFDVSGMHPASMVALNKFADNTTVFEKIRQARLAIKHQKYDEAIDLFPQLAKHLNEPVDPRKAKAINGALKLILNSTYGIGAATFPNPLKDPMDVDNIVAKRGSLFMITLKHAVQDKGYQVIHCKTDSIKVVNPDDEIRDYIFNFGKLYGYEFEIEHRYRKICLVNKAVYIAQNYEPNDDGQIWEATGAQFQHSYVYKTLFSREPLEFKDYCEIKTVTSNMYLDMNEDLPENEHDYNFIGKCGLFCPITPGYGGGLLYRKKDDKYYAVGGTTGYRWLEAEMVKTNQLYDYIDISYFEKLCNEAIEEISKYGSFEWFVDEVD